MKTSNFIGAWKGNDLDDCLESVYNNRGLIMFNKYKYKACQCLCHYKYEKYVAIECKCDCKPDSEIIKENKEWGELYFKSIDAYNKIYEENKQLFENIEQLKDENKRFESDNNIPLREINCPDCNPERKPHKCPVCYGKGKELANAPMNNLCLHLLSSNFFMDALGNTWKKCHTCNGTGIVWEPE